MNPGSKEAIEAGCTCPVLDNGRGRGYYGQPGVFVYTVGCPVHTARFVPDPNFPSHDLSGKVEVASITTDRTVPHED